MKTAIAIFAALAAASVALAHDDAARRPAVSGPADAYVYELAAPGAYALPAIRHAAHADLIDETGAPASLANIFTGRITVLAFIYTRCGEVCPLASGRMADLQALAAEYPEVARELTLVSLSFDPAYDTPARMADYAETFRGLDVAAPDWLFLTAPGEAEIAPVIDAYGQPIARKRDPDSPGGPLSHLLRVFLVDAEGVVRNIYSADFLDPRLVLNDVRTLRIEAARKN